MPSDSAARRPGIRLGSVAIVATIIACLVFTYFGGDPPQAPSAPARFRQQDEASPRLGDGIPARVGFELLRASWDLSVPAEGETRRLKAPSPIEQAKARKWENLDIGVTGGR